MSTRVQFTLDIDQQIGMSLEFVADFKGNPDDGFELNKATLIGQDVHYLAKEGPVVSTKTNEDLTDWFDDLITECKWGLDFSVEVPNDQKPKPGQTLSEIPKMKSVSLQELITGQFLRDEAAQREMYSVPAYGFEYV